MVEWVSAVRCEACGDVAVAAFVQGGSYFYCCTACRAPGPATSWVALQAHLQGRIKAVLVNPDFEPLATLAEGEASAVINVISAAVAKGDVVRLYTATS